MARGMNRLLLALLALLAGLVTQVSPGQARMGGVSDTEIGVTETGRSGARTAPSQSAAIDAPVARQERRDREFARIRPPRARVYIPSVLFGADRAFE